jgi:hypothetical protein
VNRQTGQPFSFSDACFERGAGVSDDRHAAAEAIQGCGTVPNLSLESQTCLRRTSSSRACPDFLEDRNPDIL